MFLSSLRRKPLVLALFHALLGVALLSTGSIAHSEENSPPPASFTMASKERDKTLSIYGVNSEVSENGGNSSGVGFKFDSEFLKLKSEGTKDFFNLGTVVKFNPFDRRFYVKGGAAFVNQKVTASDGSSARVNQYSAALASGYMVKDDVYVEAGGSSTQLRGGQVGSGFLIDDEATYRFYFEGVKRWDVGGITVDSSFNVGRLIPEFGSNETTYGAVLDIYPTLDTKLGYTYQHENNNVSHGVEAQYGYLAASYQRNISRNTYQATLGLVVAFDNLLDAKSYRKPARIVPHLSELHAFENIVLNSNMRIQSSKGVQGRGTTPDTILGL